jgi:hypothetical protein
MVALTVTLIAEFVVASVLALTATGRAAQTSPISIAIVGDSYTAGVQNKMVWPTLLAQRTGWSVANFALPEAGYVADGRGGYAFTYQVDRALQMRPDAIVIVGGLADTRLGDTGSIAVGAIDAINKIKVGGKRAFVIGPTWYEEPVPDSVTQVSLAVQTMADEADVPFLNALDPPWLTRDYMRFDESAPTDQGQSLFADKVAAWLRTEVAQ